MLKLARPTYGAFRGFHLLCCFTSYTVCPGTLKSTPPNNLSTISYLGGAQCLPGVRQISAVSTLLTFLSVGVRTNCYFPISLRKLQPQISPLGLTFMSLTTSQDVFLKPGTENTPIRTMSQGTVLSCISARKHRSQPHTMMLNPARHQILYPSHHCASPYRMEC